MVIKNDLALTFCNHHFKKYTDSLVSQDWEAHAIEDESLALAGSAERS
jgi:hypothetical protein